MLSHWKKFVIASSLALAVGTAALAAPGTLAQFDPATVAGETIVALNDSNELNVSLQASSVLEAGQLIRLEYGGASLDTLLKIKSVIAPEGITVSMTDCGISSSDNGAMLDLEFEVSNTAYNLGSFPVQVILENTETGETTTVNLIVQAQ